MKKIIYLLLLIFFSCSINRYINWDQVRPSREFVCDRVANPSWWVYRSDSILVQFPVDLYWLYKPPSPQVKSGELTVNLEAICKIKDELCFELDIDGLSRNPLYKISIVSRGKVLWDSPPIWVSSGLRSVEIMGFIDVRKLRKNSIMIIIVEDLFTKTKREAVFRI